GDAPDPAEDQSAVEKALGCSLEWNPRFARLKRIVDGSCELPLSTASLRRAGRIQLLPLVAHARAKNIQRLVVLLYLPDTDIFDSQPAPTAPVLENTGGPSQLLRRLNRSRVYSWSLGATVPEVIAFSFGFTPRTVNRAALASALILLIPILFVSWLGRKALSAPDSD